MPFGCTALVNDDETATAVVITVATVVDLVDVDGEGGGARVVGRYANNKQYYEEHPL